MLTKVFEIYDLAYKHKKEIILMYGLIIFLFLFFSNKKTEKIYKKTLLIKEKKILLKKENKKIEIVSFSFILLAFVLQEYIFVIILLLSEVFKCRVMIKNHENTINFYESKGYNDWLRNVNKSQENEDDNE